MSDSDGETCSSYYESYYDFCGSWDTVDFIAADACCECGGGIINYEDEPEPLEFPWYK